MKVGHNERWVAVRVEGLGGAPRQCVYQLKYRHLLLRNSVFGGGREASVCAHAPAAGEHKCEEAVVTNSLGSLNYTRAHTHTHTHTRTHTHWPTAELQHVNHAAINEKKREKVFF